MYADTVVGMDFQIANFLTAFRSLTTFKSTYDYCNLKPCKMQEIPAPMKQYPTGPEGTHSVPGIHMQRGQGVWREREQEGGAGRHTNVSALLAQGGIQTFS